MKLKMHTPDGSVIVESNLVTQFYPDFESGGEMTTSKRYRQQEKPSRLK